VDDHQPGDPEHTCVWDVWREWVVEWARITQDTILDARLDEILDATQDP
jgi:hypothetical protein